MSTESPSTWSHIKSLYGSSGARTSHRLEPKATRTAGYLPSGTDWQWDWRGPHFTILFQIPHSTFSISRYAGIPTSCCDGGISQWSSGRVNLGNGSDRYTLVVPKTLRLKYYGYLTDSEFARFFSLWCTYSY